MAPTLAANSSESILMIFSNCMFSQCVMSLTCLCKRCAPSGSLWAWLVRLMHAVAWWYHLRSTRSSIAFAGDAISIQYAGGWVVPRLRILPLPALLRVDAAEEATDFAGEMVAPSDESLSPLHALASSFCFGYNPSAWFAKSPLAINAVEDKSTRRRRSPLKKTIVISNTLSRKVGANGARNFGLPWSASASGSPWVARFGVDCARPSSGGPSCLF